MDIGSPVTKSVAAETAPVATTISKAQIRASLRGPCVFLRGFEDDFAVRVEVARDAPSRASPAAVHA